MKFGQCVVGVSFLLTCVAAASAAPILDHATAQTDAELWQQMTNEGLEAPESLDVLRGAGLASAATTYTDPAAYEAAVGVFERISFTEPAVLLGDILFEQYIDVGVTFADGETTGDGDDDVVMATAGFVVDGVGVNADVSMELNFLAPQTHMGVDFPGDLRVELYAGLDLVWSSADDGDFGTAGLGNFGGVVITGATFDRAILTDPVGQSVFIDDLRYELVPEPGTLMLLGIGGLAMLGRIGRRRAIG